MPKRFWYYIFPLMMYISTLYNYEPISKKWYVFTNVSAYGEQETLFFNLFFCSWTGAMSPGLPAAFFLVNDLFVVPMGAQHVICSKSFAYRNLIHLHHLKYNNFPNLFSY